MCSRLHVSGYTFQVARFFSPLGKRTFCVFDIWTLKYVWHLVFDIWNLTIEMCDLKEKVLVEGWL